MMSSAFVAAAAAHQDSLSRMTSMTNSIAPPHSHSSHTAGQILGEKNFTWGKKKPGLTYHGFFTSRGRLKVLPCPCSVDTLRLAAISNYKTKSASKPTFLNFKNDSRLPQNPKENEGNFDFDSEFVYFLVVIERALAPLLKKLELKIRLAEQVN